MFYQVQNAGTQNIGLRPLSQTPNLASYDQLLQQYQQPQTQNHFRMQQMSSAAHSFRDQIQKIQSGPSPPDPYGLLGLLGVIRINDPELVSLALGIDLTTLGLNLNSPDNLYKTFGSPWSNEPAKGDPDFHIPACYSSEQSPPLHVRP
jgi:CCR4-NOT transcription complex subunit 2